MNIEHPVDLLYAMRNIKYGMWDYTKNKVIKWDDPEMDMPGYLDEHCYILRPAEVWEKSIGTCWDATLLAYEELSKLSHVTSVTGFFTEYISQTTGNLCTHAAVAYSYKVKDRDMWYWFDHSHPLYGLNGPCLSKDELDEFFLRMHSTLYGAHTFFNPSFDPGEILRLPGNITCNDYITIARGLG